MKKTYKNKRDFYKTQAEESQSKIKELQETLDRERRLKREEEERQRKEKEKNSWYDVLTYCTNCQFVCSYRVRKGLTINEAGCVNCNVNNTLHNVKHYPGGF